MTDGRRVLLTVVTVVAVVALGFAGATVGSDASSGPGGGPQGGDSGDRDGPAEDEDTVLPSLGDTKPWGSSEQEGSDSDPDEPGADDGGLVGETSVRSPAVGFAGLLIGGVLVAAVAYRIGGGDERPSIGDSETSVDEERDGGESLTAVGRAAGRALTGDESGAAPENVVERAWRDMTVELSLDSPETATPAEFAAAAVEAGMAESDVRELTTLFEKVRYGDADATSERGERARAALQRIERRYGR